MFIVQLLGCGKLGTLFLELFLKSGIPAENIWIETASETSEEALSTKYGVHIGRANNPTVVFLGIKPQQLSEVTFPAYSSETVVISPLAGISIAILEKYFSGTIYRIMPNILMQYEHGTTLVYQKEPIKNEYTMWLNTLLGTLGNVIECDIEEQLDKLATITGCGPAYFFYFAKVFTDIWEKNGGHLSDRDETIRHLFLGSAAYFSQSQKGLGECIATVASKGGITQKALDTFAEKGFSDMIQSGLDEAYRRGQELSQ